MYDSLAYLFTIVNAIVMMEKDRNKVDVFSSIYRDLGTLADSLEIPTAHSSVLWRGFHSFYA